MRIAESGNQLGRGIRIIRKRLRWKQAVLAEEAGLNVATISLIESAKTNPSYYDLEKIATALKTSVPGLLAAGKLSLNISSEEAKQIVAERIRFRRSELGLSRSEAADLTGFLPQYISTTELGRRLPLVRSLISFARGFEVRPSWLLGASELHSPARFGLPVNADEVGDRLKAIRVKRNMTLDAACRASGVGFRHLERLESCEQLPTVATLYALKNGIGFDIDEVLDA